MGRGGRRVRIPRWRWAVVKGSLLLPWFLWGSGIQGFGGVAVAEAVERAGGDAKRWLGDGVGNLGEEKPGLAEEARDRLFAKDVFGGEDPDVAVIDERRFGEAMDLCDGLGIQSGTDEGAHGKKGGRVVEGLGDVGHHEDNLVGSVGRGLGAFDGRGPGFARLTWSGEGGGKFWIFGHEGERECKLLHLFGSEWEPHFDPGAIDEASENGSRGDDPDDFPFN